MRPVLEKNILRAFWLFAAADLFALAMGSWHGHSVFKPLLIPTLILALFLKSKFSPTRKFAVLALILAFLGDVFLLKEKDSSIFFILGLGSFLLAHIFYCCYFIACKKTGRSLLGRKPYLAVGVVLYAGGLVLFLLPGLGELKVPVIVYAFVLAAMLISCLYAFESIKPQARALFITGAFAFVISDSLLAIDKFYSEFPGAPVLIMLTYIIAQYLIVSGVIKNDG